MGIIIAASDSLPRQIHARNTLVTAFLWILMIPIVFAQSPIVVANSNGTFGPDGPWYAARVWIGAKNQSFDLYPGIVDDTLLISSTYCTNSSQTINGSCTPRAAGLYSGTTPPKAQNSMALEYAIEGYEPPLQNVLNGKQYVDNVTVSFFSTNDSTSSPQVYTANDVSLFAMDYVYVQYPTNTGEIPPNPNAVVNRDGEIGVLDLGGPQSTEDASKGYGQSLPDTLFKNKLIPSSSFGLFVGNPSIPNMEQSLVLGGFDRNRVIGAVGNFTIQSENAPGYLGAFMSGWNIKSANGSLAAAPLADPKNFTAINCMMVPQSPYMYLPLEMCQQMTKDLPVYYDSQTNFFLWNVTDPRYHPVVNSATYYEFNFTKTNYDTTVLATIRAPMMLFDLELDSIEGGNRYFPCYPFNNANNMAEGMYTLGRAFLQAAYIGVNWMPNGPANSETGIKGAWFLGQATGPQEVQGEGVDAIPLGPNDVGIEQFGDYNNWVDSWADTWTPLPAEYAYNASSTPSSTPSPSPSSSSSQSMSSSGLSTGAKVGLGVGLGVGGAILIAVVAALLLMRRRKRQNKDDTRKVYKSEADSRQIRRPQELDSAKEVSEMETPQNHEIHELDADADGVVIHEADSGSVDKKEP